MAALTTYLSDALLDHALRNTAYAPVATVYLALFTTATNIAGGGTEVVGGGYARQPVTFSVAAAQSTNNTADVVFPVAGAPWGTITHCAIMDQLAGGNMLLQGPLAVPKVVGAGDSLQVLSTQFVAGLV